MRITSILASMLLAVSLLACTMVKVPAGNVGIKVNLYGSERGVENEELTPGRYWLTWNEEIYTFPTFQQNYVWTQSIIEASPTDESITFSTVEGLTVSADVGITYHIDPVRVNTVFQTYRMGVDEITHTFLRQMVRDALVEAASSRPIESVYGEGKSALLDDVESRVRAECEPIGIIVDHVSFIGDFRLPPTVRAAIDAKIQATQQAQQRENEVAQAEAQANILRAEAQGRADSRLIEATADASANTILSASLTPELVTYQSILRWNGAMPLMTGGVMPMISMPTSLLSP